MLNPMRRVGRPHRDPPRSHRRDSLPKPAAMPIHRRVLGYARVSSREQALGTSLADQEAALSAYARSLGLRVDRMFTEAESGGRRAIEKRVQMTALMSTVRAGDLVLVDKLDRWSRDAEHTYKTVREILEAGASFYAVGEGLDPSTHSGDSELGFRVLFAREEHKRIRQRTVGTRALLRAKGYWVEGLPPWGYRRPEAEGLERNVLVVDEEEAAKVRRAFALCIAGRSLGAIARELGQKIDRVKDALHSRAYLGEMRDAKGVWAPARHPAIVDAATWTRANDAIQGRRYSWSKEPAASARTATWWLRDVARCSCGSKHSAGWSKDRDYFLCRARCGARWVPVRVAEAACDPIIVDRLRVLAEDLARPSTATSTKVDTSAQLAKLNRRRERTLDLFAEGAIDRAEMRQRLDAIAVDKTRVEAAALAAAGPTPEDARRRLADVQMVALAWQTANGVERRELVRALVKTVTIVRDSAPVVVWRSDLELREEE